MNKIQLIAITFGWVENMYSNIKFSSTNKKDDVFMFPFNVSKQLRQHSPPKFLPTGLPPKTRVLSAACSNYSPNKFVGRIYTTQANNAQQRTAVDSGGKKLAKSFDEKRPSLIRIQHNHYPHLVSYCI